VIDEELQQAQAGTVTVQMTPQRQTVAQSGVEVFDRTVLLGGIHHHLSVKITRLEFPIADDHGA
jgi:hypothetical protein